MHDFELIPTSNCYMWYNIRELGEWADNNYQTFNPCKSKPMIFFKKDTACPSLFLSLIKWLYAGKRKQN